MRRVMERRSCQESVDETVHVILNGDENGLVHVCAAIARFQSAVSHLRHLL